MFEGHVSSLLTPNTIPDYQVDTEKLNFHLSTLYACLAPPLIPDVPSPLLGFLFYVETADVRVKASCGTVFS